MVDTELIDVFFDYLIIDNDGWNGIKDNAPEKAKQAYAEFEKMQREARNKGIKI